MPVADTVPTVLFPPWTPLTAQLTEELKFPVPCTVAEHWLVCPTLTVADAQETATDVMEAVGGGVGVCPPIPLPLPPQPTTHNEPRKEKTSKVLHVIRASSKPNCPGKFDVESVAWGSSSVCIGESNDPITLSENIL